MVGGGITSLDRSGAMKVLEYAIQDRLAARAALALAALFIYAVAVKIREPVQFADTIYGFTIRPAFLNLFALSLPVFEIACGLLLVEPQTRRIGALGVAPISVVNFAALVRGLTLDCGCFGNEAPSRGLMWLKSGLMRG